MNKPMEVSVVIPVFNEAKSIRDVVAHVDRVLCDRKIEHEILVVDDGSVDLSGDEAALGGATVLRRPYNIGNGAAVKHGIRKASGDVIVMMDGDGQHDPEDIPRFLEEIKNHEMVVGARTRESETQFHRDMANFGYSRLASYIVGRKVIDLTSGYRAFDGEIAKKVVYLFPNGYSYPSTSTIALFRAGYSVKYIPIKTSVRYGNSKIRLFGDGFGFLLILLRIGTLFAPLRIFLPLALVVFLPGFLLAIHRLFTGRPWTIPVVISITAGLLILVLGLISEQIALLRMSRLD
jgi:glycosyltransferase involved in cell wall biosynthesis